MLEALGLNTLNCQGVRKDYQKEFIDILLRAEAVKFGSFTTKSGRITPYFCNCGALTTGKDIAKAGEALARVINESGVKYDVLFGAAYKGIPFVTTAAIGLNTLFGKNVEFAFNRKETKGHGEGGNLVGCSLKGKKVFIVDDVISTGMTIKETIDLIKMAGGEPVGAALLFDRQEKADNSELSAVQQAEKEFNIRVVCAVKFQDLFKHIKNNEECKKYANEMEKYYAKYGINNKC